MSYVFRKNFDENKLPGIFFNIKLHNINLRKKIQTMEWKFNYLKIKIRVLALVTYNLAAKYQNLFHAVGVIYAYIICILYSIIIYNIIKLISAIRLMRPTPIMYLYKQLITCCRIPTELLPVLLLCLHFFSEYITPMCRKWIRKKYILYQHVHRRIILLRLRRRFSFLVFFRPMSLFAGYI